MVLNLFLSSMCLCMHVCMCPTYIHTLLTDGLVYRAHAYICIDIGPRRYCVNTEWLMPKSTVRCSTRRGRARARLWTANITLCGESDQHLWCRDETIRRSLSLCVFLCLLCPIGMRDMADHCALVLVCSTVYAYNINVVRLEACWVRKPNHTHSSSPTIYCDIKCDFTWRFHLTLCNVSILDSCEFQYLSVLASNVTHMLLVLYLHMYVGVSSFYRHMCV